MKALSFVMFAVLAACPQPKGGGDAGSQTDGGPGGDAGQAQASIHGQLVAATTSALTTPASLAVAWYPAWASSSPSAPPAAITTQSITYQGNFPIDFTFDLNGPPPPAARVALTAVPDGGTGSTTGAGSGQVAFGVLVAYDDLNHDGTLDVIPDGGTPIDDIIGVSVIDPSLPPPARSYFILYLDGTIAPGDYWDYEDLQQGYNVVAVHYGYGLERIALDAGVSIQVTQSPALNLFACGAAFQGLAPFQSACGINPYGGRYQAQAAMDNSEGQFFVNNDQGYLGTATILADGVAATYDPTVQVYYSPGFSAGSHQLSISVPGFSAETLTAVVPDVVQISTPLANQTIAPGAAVDISWTAAAGANEYDVILQADSGKVLFHVLTTALSATTPPIQFQGTATMHVVALGAQATGAQGSYATPVSYSTHTHVTFGP